MLGYLRFLLRMGFTDPKTFFKDFLSWNLYSFLPGRAHSSPSPVPILRYEEVEEAVKIFYRDGFVVLSDGMTLDELSGYLVKLGCQEAMNLDGGGSATLWYNGKVQNSPCDGQERVIANSLLLVRKSLNPRNSDGGGARP